MKRAVLILMICISGCTLAKVDVEVLSERTALENQILGTYNSLDREMLMVASVRGVDTQGNIRKPPVKSREKQDAIAAIQLIDFHSDDLFYFKKLGWVGENNKGLLEPFEMDKKQVPPELMEFSRRFSPEEFNSIVREVNQARLVIMQRVIDMNENLKDSDMPKVQQIFAGMNAENADAGDKIQDDRGAWTQKP
ncbi:MAG: DUF1318 domain-containing protein [Desulfobacteraceae bacterium]|nr:MAG: DUF1318 domain-containing protein [Desulfobacteraceae bacterium]